MAQMFVTRKRLPRRTILRGLGAAIALPLLDAMVPAFASAGETAALTARRFIAVYVGNGMNMAAWTPPDETVLTLSPVLEPLAPFRERLLVLSGLDNEPGRSVDAGGLHSRIQPAWLTGTQAKRTEGPDVEAGTSLDQIVASQFGRHTQLPSLELSLESVDLARSCEPSYACTYVSTLAWRTPTTPLPMEVDPRAVFERLFGDRRDATSRRRDLERDRSVLDWVADDIAGLQKGLGAADRRAVDEYVSTIRSVEQHLERAATPARDVGPLDVGRFLGVPDTFDAHMALMADLLKLACQADITRVATLLMVRERSDRVFPESGVSEAIHPLSHHGDDPGKLRDQATVNRFLVRQFGRLLERFAATPEGDGSLLDRTTVLFGAGMSNSNLHDTHGVPTLVVGGPGRLAGGRHIRCPRGTPLSNLQVTLLDALGMPVDHFGDSTGGVPMLAGL